MSLAAAHPDTLRDAVEAGRLDMGRSLAAIREAASQRRCLSYADIAAASFLSWNAARRRMDPHLFAVCAMAQSRGWPLLSAIVVNKHLVAAGRMEGRTLAGFSAMVARLGAHIGPDPAAFLRAEQARVFDWASREAPHDLHH
jgi:5-methylcytosine-specific restriction protein B